MLPLGQETENWYVPRGTGQEPARAGHSKAIYGFGMSVPHAPPLQDIQRDSGTFQNVPLSFYAKSVGISYTCGWEIKILKCPADVPLSKVSGTFWRDIGGWECPAKCPAWKLKKSSKRPKNNPSEYFPIICLPVYCGVNDRPADNLPLPMSACFIANDPALLFQNFG